MPVYLFEANQFYALSPGETVGGWGMNKRAQVVRYLQSLHLPLLTVRDGLFVRATGKWSSNVPMPNNYAHGTSE
jgi:capsule polysaccharide export protein KpsC/LpsZ